MSGREQGRFGAWYLLFCFVLSVIGAAGCGGGASSEDGEVKDARVRVDDLELSRMPDGVRIISGRLYNASSRRIDNVQIQIALYDSDNVGIAVMHVLVRDIEPGEHQPFRETVSQELDAHGARARSVLVR